MEKLSLILITSLMTNGCATSFNASPKVVEKTSYVVTPLALPYRPDLPKLKNSDMACLSDETKNALIQRDNLQKQYISELEAIIDSTH